MKITLDHARSSGIHTNTLARLMRHLKDNEPFDILEINKVGDVLDIVNCWSASGLHEKEARLLAMKCVDLILPVSDNIHMETVRRYINGQASKDELMKSNEKLSKLAVDVATKKQTTYSDYYLKSFRRMTALRALTEPDFLGTAFYTAMSIPYHTYINSVDCHTKVIVYVRRALAELQ